MMDFRLPSLGADMERAKLVEWLVTPGQRVKRGDVVAIIETEKGAVELEIWDEGVITELIGKIDADIAVGEVMARLTPDVEPAVAAPATAPTTPASAAAPAPPPVAPPPTPAGAPTARIKISPAARRLAQEMGIDIDALTPSGADGVLSLADVQAAAQGRRAAAVPPDKQRAMREAIAAAMSKSKREIPHYYLGTTLEVGPAMEWLTRLNAQRAVKDRILFAALTLKAIALALKQVPQLNGHWVDGQFRPATAIHLGVALALRGGGLIAPALHDADTLSLSDTMAGLSSLIQRTRSGALRSSELTDATVTVTNLGDLGVETVYGVIYPPQVALVGLGKVVQRPWIKDGQVQAARVLHVTLSADHRASVGQQGAQFLAALEGQLQQPEGL